MTPSRIVVRCSLKAAAFRLAADREVHTLKGIEMKNRTKMIASTAFGLVIAGAVMNATFAVARPFGGGCNKGTYCLDVYRPVTCSNGQTYSNDCYAAKACATGCVPSGDR